MSVENQDFPVHQEDDQVPARTIVAVAIASVVIGATGVFLSGFLLVSTTGALRPDGAGAEGPRAGGRTLSQVEQTPVMATQIGIDTRKSQKRELETWGWVDRGANVAKIPIERAIDIVVAEGAR
jgi:hypothetical protein